MTRYFLMTPLALALALGLGGAIAATPDAAREKELEAARADLHRAAQRVAELSKADGAEEDLVIERRMVRGPVLGVVLEPDARAGVLIAAVTPGSAAGDAGLKEGDRLTSVDGKAIAGVDADTRLSDLRTRLHSLDVKRPVALGYLRDGRAATVKVTPRNGEQLVLVHDADGQEISFHGEPSVSIGPNGETQFESRMVRIAPAGVAPEIHREIVRIDGGGPPCRDETCRFTMLEDALRWNGLNLASLGPQLGRYFGSDRGVLVISIPDGMGGLQPGDVILKLDGKNVTTPREAMGAAHAHEPGSTVRVEYLRDRKQASTTLKIPERPQLRLPMPPAPPAPPLAPRAHGAPRAAAMPAPPAPPPVPAVPRSAPAPMALAAPAAPPSPPAPPADDVPPAPDAPPPPPSP